MKASPKQNFDAAEKALKENIEHFQNKNDEVQVKLHFALLSFIRGIRDVVNVP